MSKNSWLILAIAFIVVAAIFFERSIRDFEKEINSDKITYNDTFNEFKGLEKIIYQAGNYDFKEDLVIKKNQVLILKPGTHFFFRENTGLQVYGKLRIYGSQSRPVTLTAKDKTWSGIKIFGELNPEPEIAKDYESPDTKKVFLKIVDKIYKIQTNSETDIQAIAGYLEVSNVKNSYKEKHAAVYLQNSNTYFDNLKIENIEGVLAIYLNRSKFGIENSSIKSCETDAILYIGHSQGKVVKTKIEKDCEAAAPHKLGSIAMEGMIIEASTVFLSMNQIYSSADDCIEAVDSNIIAIGNAFEKCADNIIDLKSNSNLIAIENKAKDLEGFSIAESRGLFFKNEIFSKGYCFLLRRPAKAYIYSNQCHSPQFVAFEFDLRRCLIYGPCRRDEETKKKAEFFLKKVNPKWQSKSFVEMINYGGEYKEVLKHYPKNRYSKQYHKFFAEVEKKFGSYTELETDAMTTSKNKKLKIKNSKFSIQDSKDVIDKVLKTL